MLFHFLGIISERVASVPSGLVKQFRVGGVYVPILTGAKQLTSCIEDIFYSKNTEPMYLFPRDLKLSVSASFLVLMY